MVLRGFQRKRSMRSMPSVGPIVQVGCKLWNLSVLSILILTVFNILLMLRLLNTECTSISSEPAPKPQVPLPPLILENLLPSNTSPIFNVDPRLGRWDARHLFKMIDHALVGSNFIELSTKNSVCLATQSSLEKLHSLVQVAHHWSGPISVALFAAGDEEFSLLQGYIDFLRRCYVPVRERISFHLAFPKEKIPTSTYYVEKTTQLDCLGPEASLGQMLKLRSPDIVRWRIRNRYPQNHMRNLARRNCQTSHVFLTDIDIIPSTNLAEALDLFIKTETCKGGKCAYVIPTYELDERVPFPRNKTELIRLTGRGLARPFHHKVFIYNQFATNFSRWEQDIQNHAVHISHSVTNFEFLYEPFYVAPDIVPPHDERFLGYGFTRNTQVYEMYVAGYEFFVLSPVFTIHWGLQNRKGRPSWRERQNTNNRRNFDQFKREVFARYHKDPLNMILPHAKDSSNVKA
ncbi:beta-1,4-glucuronyltransferase 1 isoform X2 [Cimex lectularius]|uniref:Beta-1,4-glucuronyltransferase 1 n=1 Tax=Cimex lectularius TaxID=79782 RepID=A0A8I6SAR0_CIMLE|nr:beta-1,4-glucuronyltransferase 1 isoform X2 [Cimex lectularius]